MKFNLENTSVTQGSVLSLFLFNVYIHELDEFMEKLMRKQCRFFTSSSEVRKNDDKKKYIKIVNEFSIRNLMTLLKKYDTAEEMKAAMFRIRELDELKHKRFYGIGFSFRHIDYVRYADNFLIGIVGPKEFVIEIRSKVDQFVKGDLHLGIQKNDIVNRNDGAVQFLEFAIYLPRSCNKTRVK